jgi:hypothetical protein
MKELNRYGPENDQLKGVSRRDFMNFCGMMAVGMGLPLGSGARIAKAITNPKRRSSAIWLHGQESAGCRKSLLRTSHPSIEHLLSDLFSLDHHETLNTGFGHQAEAAFKRSIRISTAKTSPHQTGLADVLAIAAMTGDQPPNFALFGIEPGALTTGLVLSRQVADNLGRMVEMVVAELKSIGVDIQPKKR